MCYFYSFIVTRDLKILDAVEIDDHHESIIKKYNLEDNKLKDRDFVRCELLPDVKNIKSRFNDKYWQFRLDEPGTAPEWFYANDKKIKDLSMEHLKKNIWQKYILVDKKIYKLSGNQRISVLIRSIINEMFDSSQVGAVYDSSQVGVIHNSSQVGVMYDSSQVGEMFDSSRIGTMRGSSRVGTMFNSSRVGVMFGSSRFGVMRDSSRIGVMYDSSQVGVMYDSSRIGVMYDSSQVGVMYDSSRIGTMRGSSSVSIRSDKCKINSIKDKAISVYRLHDNFYVVTVNGKTSV